MRDYEERSYYEIQLDNKQLILVFLAAITVCVLIFILGVMIGKGQKEAELASINKTEAATAKAEPDMKPPEQPLAQIAEEAKQEKKPESVKPAKEKERYAFEDLDKSAENTESKKSPEPVREPKTEPVVAPPKAEVTRPDPEIKKGPQYTVQVMATASRQKAEEQMTILKARGYKPFLDESGSVFKVRIGRFSDSLAAKDLSTRLKKELRLEPWVAVID
jgi:cell division septation protein DedD